MVKSTIITNLSVQDKIRCTSVFTCIILEVSFTKKNNPPRERRAKKQII